MGHMCARHQCLFDLDHIKVCDQLSNVERIPEFAKLLKEVPFIEWDKDLKLDAIGAYALLVIQLEHLTKNERASLVHTKATSNYVKTGNKRGRPSNAAKVANNNMKID